jgi:NhaP-type Na+/H+ or K+/H+ antiporter
MSIQLDTWKPIVIGLGITVMLFILRIPVVRLAISKKDRIPDKDLMYMSAIDPKGLTAAVLATQALAYIPEVETGLFIRNIVFSVILFSIVINSILIPLISHEKGMYRIYQHMLSVNQKMKNAVSQAKDKQKEKRKKNSKARELADEMFYSDVVAEVFKDQDKPGALSHPESSNSDVAD